MENPYLGYARAAAVLNPPVSWSGGIHETASVCSDARVHQSAWVGPNAVIEAGAQIEADVFVGPCCTVGRDTLVGESTRLVANVTLCHGVRIGRRVLVHPGAVVGADGFGIANDEGVWVKVPQLGGVQIADDVEIGANTTIDRGALEDTVIETGVKLDNQIQIGHNVRVGPHTAIAGCVAIAGSVRIGARCTIGGSSALSGHIEIADDVHLTGGTQVAKSIPAPGIYSSGIPAQENRNWRKMVTRFAQLDSLFRRLRVLERHSK
jgi:UDP-3-O-[3-hydroxymyristoyl] glucosamine N-acyltransferase